MELTIALLLTGILVLAFNLYRTRRLLSYARLYEYLKDTYNVTDIDLSGSTEYTHCYSYEWIFENLTRKKSGRIGNAIQRHLADNTLSMGMFLAFLIGIAGMAIGFVFLVSTIFTGTAFVVFLIGLALAIGPGNPRFSEQLLDELVRQDLTNLNHEDYVYVVLARRSISTWIKISSLVGGLFIVAAPWGESLPSILAFVVSSFAIFFLLEPAIRISEFSVPLAILYLFVVPVILLIVIPKTIYQRVKHDKDMPEPIR